MGDAEKNHLHLSNILPQPFTPKSDQFQISPAVYKNITSHSMKNLAFHNLYADERWLHYHILTTSLTDIPLQVGRMCFLNLGMKEEGGLIWTAPYDPSNAGYEETFNRPIGLWAGFQFWWDQFI